MNILETTENIEGQAYTLVELAKKMQNVLYLLEEKGEALTYFAYEDFKSEIDNEGFDISSIYHYNFEMTLQEFTTEVSEEYYSKFLIKYAELIFDYERYKVIARIYQDIIKRKMSLMTHI